MTAAADEPEAFTGRPGTSPPAVWRGLFHEVAAQGARFRLWTPVAFGLGAAGYLELRAEPSIWRGRPRLKASPLPEGEGLSPF